MAIGEGEGHSAIFQAYPLAAYLKLDPLILYYHFQLFEKAGLLMISGDMRKRSVLKMLFSGNELQQYYKKYPAKEDFIKNILRSYGGLFSDYVVIQEELLGRRSEESVEEVQLQLKELHQEKVLSYIPKDQKDRILFMQDRIDDKYLYFSPDVYIKRKEVAKKRLTSVLNFVENTEQCRSQILLAYFGEIKSVSCRKCDICLSHRHKEVTHKEYKAIYQAIEQLSHHTSHEIIEQLSKLYDEKKVIDVLRKFLEK